MGKFAQGEVKYVERIPETLWAWLPEKKSGPIAPKWVKHWLTEFHKDLGYRGNEWPCDVARHSLASHYAALSGSVETVAAAINHKDSSTTLKYCLRRVSPDAGKAYFQILPKAIG